MKTVSLANGEEWEEQDEVYCPRCATKGMWKEANSYQYVCVSCNRTFFGRLVPSGEHTDSVIALIKESRKLHLREIINGNVQ